MALTQISTQGIKDGTITNADLNASAAIAGTKISPDFGSQNISTTGTLSLAAVAGTNTNAALNVLFQTSAGVIDGGSGLTYNPGGDSLSVNGNFINANTFRGDGNLGRLTCDNHSSTTTVDVSSTVNILTNDNATDAFSVKQGSNEYITVDTNNSSELITLGNTTTNPKTAILGGNVGIGTTSPNQLLEVANSSGGATISISTDEQAGSQASKKYNNLDFTGYNNNVMARIQSWDESSNTGHGYLTFFTNKNGVGFTEKLRIDPDGNVGIGLTNPGTKLDVAGDGTFRVANSTSYQAGFNITNAVTTDLQVWIKNNAVAIGPSTASEINFVTGGNTGTRLSIAANGEATFSQNIVLEGGSDHAYPHIRLHSSAANVRKWTIYNGQSWNPDALLIYDTDADSTALTIETNKLGVNKGANSLTHNLEVGGSATISGNTAIGTSSPVNNSGYGGLTLNGDNGAIFSFKDSDVEKTRLAVVLNDTFSIQYPPGSSGHLRIDQLTADGSNNITGASERIRVTSDGNTVFTDKDSGHIGGGVYSRTKTVTLSGDNTTSFMKFSLTHGALAAIVYLTGSNNGSSVSRVYAVSCQFNDNDVQSLAYAGVYGGNGLVLNVSTSGSNHTFQVEVSGGTQEVTMAVHVGNANQDITYTEL